jgi:hypothetical protein
VHHAALLTAGRPGPGRGNHDHASLGGAVCHDAVAHRAAFSLVRRAVVTITERLDRDPG